ncbi:unnamed protein product [Schistosoma margrebowiei]|uniref:Uncharacterized protein n=1 Tax=Schistosoma margrebowiei TaxID=48269 RepID=A0A183MLC9_9TREM|nr:unnamed protein product [Schistosoma margrebowiei]
MSLLTTRATIYLGKWNARTMWETEGVIQIAAEIRRYNPEVLGINETHWTQVEQQRIASGELLLYSDHEEENDPHTHRVALMLCPNKHIMHLYDGNSMDQGSSRPPSKQRKRALQ